MSKTPLINVIMTIYNAEEYIEDSINSILNQTFKNFKLNIFLDGCTDNTEDICNNILKSSEISYSIKKDDIKKGCPERRQQLINNCNSEYIVIQDGDDISYPNRFEKEIYFLKNNPEIFCVGSFADKINESGENIGIMDYPPECHYDIIKMVEECENPIIDPTTMFRRKIFNNIGGYSLDKKIWTVPDFDLWLRAILVGKKFHNIQKSLVKYRVNEKGVTRKHKKEMIEQHMTVWKKFMRRYKK